jgi:hypothetical protein
MKKWQCQQNLWVKSKGKLEKHHYQNAENIDWEEITKDKEGIYIGDFGNNENKKKFIKLQRLSLRAY